ncbi:ribonuclease H-like domain-containing protein [Cognatilysobacter bugurensis]|uniref:YprB ribonuclease H-like domain-containing protein n=1 Tax=Cognatilysobacter bugurensis TaxID=543356 RepID=A0A918T3N7_9GAMM|nr:ribonuclease H-like domain-containing protein [Lysobacter bugurensis]GHA87394.1 hypothetical protein GCM10007067_26650 [Lysobacter bugurensis]
MRTGPFAMRAGPLRFSFEGVAMTVTLDRLRALKRQAGAPTPTPRRDSPAAPNPVGVPGGAPPASTADPTTAAASRPSTSLHTAASPAAPWDEVLRRDAAQRGQPAPDANASAARHAAAPASTPHPSASPTLGSLRRLLGVRDRAPVAAPRTAPDRALPGVEIAPGLHLIETRLPHAPPLQALPLAFARREDAVDPASLLFFDTETTGLAGGTGTRAFMIGAADWHDGDLRIRQLLISTLAAETAMLREFASWLAPHTVLTSYNGRSYDAPLLKTRYRLARLPDALHGLDHVDLLHPTRRRYRGHWENCRLATIERELLRIVREDDLPGSQAPMAWLTYLRGGSSGLLRRVAAHNHQDVVTLARLLQRLVEAQASDT